MKPRKMRFTFCGKGPNGKNLCYYGCGKECVPPKRNWCSPECVREGLIRSDPNYARRLVKRRDKEICSRCQADTHRLKKECYPAFYAGPKKLWDWNDESQWQEAMRIERESAAKAKARHAELIALGWSQDLSRAWWECHHKLAVIEGGGGCGLDNLETLCVVCHKKETKELAARRKLTRKQSKVDLGLCKDHVPKPSSSVSSLPLTDQDSSEPTGAVMLNQPVPEPQEKITPSAAPFVTNKGTPKLMPSDWQAINQKVL